MRKAITADKSKLQKAIQKYYSVQEYLPPSERIEIDANDIVGGEFPWSALTGMYVLLYRHTNCLKNLILMWQKYGILILQKFILKLHKV